MSPSKASTSRTKVPFASPPMLGLQLISPMLALGCGVTRTVLAPRLADAAAASQPAHTAYELTVGQVINRLPHANNV